MTQWGIDTLFNPGKRHMDEEKRRLQSTREEIGDSSGGKRIDLESGKVRLAGRPGEEPAEAAETETDQAADEQPQDGQLQDEQSQASQQRNEPPPNESAADRARRRRRNAAAG